jgi:ketosteroid isomerase-like protein
VDESWERFMAAVKDAQREMGAGRPEPFKALWAHTDDVVIMGGFGGYERGWEQVSARLDWASKGLAAAGRSEENIVTVAGEDLGYTVDLEHMTRHVDGQPRPLTLRCTQVYRRENGEWKVVLRHADALVQKDEQQR